MFRSIEVHFCHKVCLVLVVKYQLNEIHDWNWSAEEEKQGRRKLTKSGWASSKSLAPLVNVLICQNLDR